MLSACGNLLRRRSNLTARAKEFLAQGLRSSQKRRCLVFDPRHVHQAIPFPGTCGRESARRKQAFSNRGKMFLRVNERKRRTRLQERTTLPPVQSWLRSTAGSHTRDQRRIQPLILSRIDSTGLDRPKRAPPRTGHLGKATLPVSTSSRFSRIFMECFWDSRCGQEVRLFL